MEWGSGNPDSADVQGSLIDVKRKLAKQNGAAALIERKRPASSWENTQEYFSSEQVLDEGADSFVSFVVNDKDSVLPAIPQNQPATISTTGNQIRTVHAKNVMGWVEGTDAKLKNQFVVLSAHYDHLGVAKQPIMQEGKLDSIYNGARDNGVGTTAMIDAARYFAAHPAKRSILFITFTAEEMGLIGSEYFAAHPALPLKQIVYDLNIDNASYNDTTAITLVGLGRTSAYADITKACAAYYLHIVPDPTQEQWLFSGSDNFPLAERGIPAPTFSLGMKKLDSTIFNRYHQVSDEVENFNLTYAIKFINAFTLAAKYIADNPEQPTWSKGDKYEVLWRKLQQ